ncbi:MAG: hypothetical protein WCA22_06750 [Candidatus Binatus sp.]
MATMVHRKRATEIHSVGFIDHAKDSEIPGWEVAVDRLIGELVCAFFIAMAVMWIVTTIAGLFG